MPGVSITTAEPDVARAECGRVYFPHRLAVLHEPSAFRMTLSAATLGPLSAGLLGYAGEVCVETGELETGYEVNVPLDGLLATWTGHAQVCASPTTAAVYRPDGRTRLHGWRGGGRLLGVKVERAALEATLAEFTDRPVPGVVALGAAIDLRSGAGAQWWSLARALIAVVEDPDGPLAHPMVARPLAHAVLAALLHAVDHPLRDALDRRPAQPRPASVREAVELLEAEPERPWTVTELAGRVGVGSRGLQDGFARHVGTSPTGYLREVRLRRAHADLLAADPGRHTVAEIALRWGFAHLGRFAAAYRRRYGQAPSQTLRS
ncbi:MAG: AraC family transcriptional regulator [Pseudonocardia sp.]